MNEEIMEKSGSVVEYEEVYDKLVNAIKESPQWAAWTQAIPKYDNVFITIARIPGTIRFTLTLELSEDGELIPMSTVLGTLSDVVRTLQYSSLYDRSLCEWTAVPDGDERFHKLFKSIQRRVGVVR